MAVDDVEWLDGRKDKAVYCYCVDAYLIKNYLHVHSKRM